MIRPLLASALLFLCVTAAAVAETVGFREMTIADAERPLHVALWYPTEASGPEETVAENPVFYGDPVIRNAMPGKGAHTLVLLSHGYGGTWRNPSWLAIRLARQGYVVAAVDHPGTTARDRDPVKAAKLWERPRDLSRTLDAVLAQADLGIARDRIAAIGHSLGGWTVAELAGGRFDGDLMMQDCAARFGAVACTVFVELGIGQGAEATRTLRGDLRDSRIGAVVTLDLGPARGFTPDSLAMVNVPFLVIGASADVPKDIAQNGKIAATKEDSRYLAQHLPKATSIYTEIAGTLHFSFLQICKPGAEEIIEEEEPGLGIVCRDGGTRNRQDIHEETVRVIGDFLAKSLPAK